MLMDGIIGGEEGGEETLLEKVSMLVESNPELLKEFSKQAHSTLKASIWKIFQKPILKNY